MTVTHPPCNQCGGAFRSVPGVVPLLRCARCQREVPDEPGMRERDRCRRCGVITKPWWSFGVGCPTRKVYCLDHVPLYYRLKVRWQEWRRP